MILTFLLCHVYEYVSKYSCYNQQNGASYDIPSVDSHTFSCLAQFAMLCNALIYLLMNKCIYLLMYLLMYFIYLFMNGHLFMHLFMYLFYL